MRPFKDEEEMRRAKAQFEFHQEGSSDYLSSYHEERMKRMKRETESMTIYFYFRIGVHN
jgi:hypothetical protein